MDLAEKIYSHTRLFPKDQTYGIVSQMQRSAISVPANIAEGRARNSRKEFTQFLGIAKGSLAELETFAILSGRLGYLNKQTSAGLLMNCEEINKLLNGLLKSLATRHSQLLYC
ncbi:MAG: four helix bundle protein [Candidatus Jettenia sp.]|nr:MAG: four helix bundle protein [Candidatus Jettenia sp.]